MYEDLLIRYTTLANRSFAKRFAFGGMRAMMASEIVF
jgi:hypothetical protein